MFDTGFFSELLAGFLITSHILFMIGVTEHSQHFFGDFKAGFAVPAVSIHFLENFFLTELSQSGILFFKL